MKKTFTSFLLGFCFFLGKTIACTCPFIPDFCQTITFQNNGEIHDHYQIHYVKVTEKLSDGMNVVVSKTYHGEDIVGQEIFIKDGNGADCNMFTGYFNVNEQLIVALNKDDQNWRLGECGVRFLKVENNQVIGQIAEGVTEVALSEFSNVANCGNLNPTPTHEPSGQIAFAVQPTLAHDQVTVRTKGIASTDLNASVFDVSGRLVHQFTIPQGSTSYGQQIPISDWKAGIYFFKLEAMGRQEVFKVVKAG